MNGAKVIESVCAVLLSTAAGTSAWAQQALPNAAEDQGSAFTLAGEILVTARRREERLQDIPATIAAVSGDDFARAGNRQLKDIANTVSGITFESFGGSLPLVSVRGDSNRLGLTEPGTGFFIDGIYINRQTQLGQGPVDVQRVEVLKGPQSTLYGKNTSVGAINIITTDPGMELGGYVDLGIGKGAHRDELIWHAEGAIDVPLAQEKAAIRLTAARHEREGYVVARNVDIRGMGYKSDLLRAKLLAQLTEALTWRLSVSYRRNDAPRYETYGTGPLTTGAFLQAPGTGTVTLGPTIWDRGGDLEPKTLSQAWMFINELAYETTIGILTSLSGYQVSKTSGLIDEGTEFPILSNALIDKNNAFSQEFRLAGAADRLTWLGGVYYLADRQKKLTQTIGFLPSSIPAQAGVVARVIDFPTSGNTVAAFGQLGYDLTETLNLTGGLRYAYDERYGFESYNQFFSNGTLVPGSFSNVKRSANFRSVTGNLVASLKLSPDVLTYASFATGNKQGGFSASDRPVGAILPYKEQEVTAYEIGLKSRPFDSVKLNLSAFWNDFKNLQVQQSLLVPGSLAPVNITTNAANARAYGVDVEFVGDISDRLRLDILYTYLNARIQDYQYSPTILLEDIPQTRSPKHSGRIGATYRGPMLGNEFTLNGNLQFKTKFTNDIFALSSTSLFLAESEGYHTWNASASYEMDMFTISAYVRNIANKQYAVAQAIFTPTAYYNVLPGEPRTFEISLSKKF